MQTLVDYYYNNSTFCEQEIFFQKSLLDLVHESRRVILVKLQAVPRDVLSLSVWLEPQRVNSSYTGNTFCPCAHLLIPASCPEKWWTDWCACNVLWKYLFAFSLLGCRVSFVVHIHHRNDLHPPRYQSQSLGPAGSLGSILIGEVGISGRGWLSHDNYVTKYEHVLVLFWMLARPWRTKHVNCIYYFSVAAIKHPEQKRHKEKSLFGGLCVRRDKWPSWKGSMALCSKLCSQSKKVRAHILSYSQEAEIVNCRKAEPLNSQSSNDVLTPASYTF